MVNFLKIRQPLRASVVTAVFCIFIILFFNYSFWQQALVAYPIGKNNLAFLLSLAVLATSIHYAILVLFNFKYLLKPVLIMILVLGAISAYAMDTYGYVITTNAYQNLFQTDSREMIDLFSLKFVFYLLFLAVIPSLLILFTKFKYLTFKRQMLHLLVALLLIGLNLSVFNKNYPSFLRNHKQVRYYLNPIRPIYSLFTFIYEHVGHVTNHSFNILDPKPVLGINNGKPRLVILVVGEADRSMNHQLNGYSRKTNPLLSVRNDVFSFKQVYSCGTETSVSVPCMFSAFKREEFSYVKGRYTENLIDLLHKSQVQVLWRDNDSGCKNVCDRVLVDDFNNASIEPYCDSFECHDEVLLHQLQDYIDSKPGDKLIVLHKKGNHGPAYYRRYPSQFEVFTPSCQSNELQDCTDQQIVNTYDNIILYTDYFLNKIISQLESNAENYQTAMLYISDHGESLGEHGLYLHAMPYWLAPKEQTHIPFMFWASKDFAVDRGVLQASLDKPLSHDNLFHSVLGLFNIQTKVYDSKLDLFKFASR